MEERLIEALSKLRGGKTKLKEMKGEYEKLIADHESKKLQAEHTIRLIDKLLREPEPEVDNQEP